MLRRKIGIGAASIAVAAICAGSTSASAGLIGDIICLFGHCRIGPPSGTTGVPEIDGSAGLAAMALVAGVAAIVYRKIKG